MVVWDDFRRLPPSHPTATIAPAILAVLAVLALPGRAIAQGVHNVHPIEATGVGAGGAAVIQSHRFRFEPWGGALWDAYRNEGGNGRPAWIGAVRLGYELGANPMTGRGWRVTAELARAEAAEAGTAVLQDSIQVGFRTGWWLATAGLEWDALSTGWMGLTLEGSGGAAWIEREIVAGDPIPPGTPGTTATPESEPVPTFLFGLSAWRHISHTVQVRVRVADVVTDPFDALEHSPALGIAARFVFD